MWRCEGIEYERHHRTLAQSFDSCEQTEPSFLHCMSRSEDYMNGWDQEGDLCAEASSCNFLPYLFQLLLLLFGQAAIVTNL